MKNQPTYPMPGQCRGIRVFSWRYIILVPVLFFMFPIAAQCQSEDTYDETLVILNVQRIGSVEIPAIIHNQEAYLPVKDIFDFLKIKVSINEDYDLITGYFINPQLKFSIDRENLQITFDKKVIRLEKTDLVQTENNLYLKSSYFGQVFGLVCTFNFRDLSVLLTTKLELPAIREMQQELMRKNMFRLKGEKKVDTTVRRSFPLFRMGMADWSVVSMQQTGEKTYTRVNLTLGANIAGGEATANLNYSSGKKPDIKQQFFNWRFVNNNNSLVKQVTAGRIITQSANSIFAPITGIQVTNTPTTYRRSYGTYTLSNKTEPGWIVELYINNILVNFMKADASGFYSFEVPMVYGNSTVKLRFYGPWGEERTSEQYISIPFNFMPLHQLEYTVSAGIVDDEYKTRFARANLNYGLSRRITIGAGAEYFSSLPGTNMIPFVNASMRVGSRILISGERTHGVRSVGIINYRSPANLQFDFKYTKYDPGQTAVKYNYLEEKKFELSKTFRTKKFSAFTRLTINDITLLKSKFTSAELLLSAVFKKFSTNLTTYAVVTDKHPLVYSNMAISLRLPAGFRITPQVQYEYRQGNFSMYRADIEKSFSNKAYLNLTYEKNNITHTSSFAIGLRYNFSFAQTFFNVRQSNHITNTMQSARGSLLYDNSSRYFETNAFNNVGKGVVIILPFLDLNCNGIRDQNEPRVAGLNLRVNGGRIEINKKDTSIRIVCLESYNEYFIELDKNSFDNVAWQMPKPIIKVAVDPNIFKSIEVPIAVVGEVSGYVMLKQTVGSNGLGRVIINIYNADAGLVTKVLTEPDGFFSYTGLAPGKYTAAVDEAQLLKLKMNVLTHSQSFTIKQNIEGDIEDGLEFILIKNNEGK